MNHKTANARLLESYKNNDLPGMQDALAQGAEPDLRLSRDAFADHIVFDTITNDRFLAFRLLMEHGANVVDRERRITLTLLAVFHRRYPFLDYLFDRFPAPTLDRSVRTSNRPVLQAVVRRNGEMVRYLVAKGCDVNGRNEEMGAYTPLDWAVRKADLEMASVLLDLGADPLLPGRSNIPTIESAEVLEDDKQRDMLALLYRYIHR